MEETNNNSVEQAAADKKSYSSYDYFTICHSFVDQIKKFNELRRLKNLKNLNFKK